MKPGIVTLLYNFAKRFMGWTLHMIMCVLLCYPVSIHMSQLLSTGRPISSSFCSFVCFLSVNISVSDSNSKMLCPIEFKLDSEIDHHHSWDPFKIGVILSVRLSVFCPFVCPSTFLFPDSNSKMVCPIKFKLDREIEHHNS